MSRYGAGITNRAGINTADSILAQLRSTSTRELKVVEVGFGVYTAPTTAPQPYLTRATAAGTSTTTLAGQAFNPRSASAHGSMDTAWSANPTITTTNKVSAGGLAVTAGGFLVWTFYDEPFVIAPSTAGGLCVVVANASGATVGAHSIYYIWDED